MKVPPRSYVDTSLGQLAYRRAGRGPAVVMIHGALVTADDMVLAMMAPLSEDFDVIAFDRPGHGGSQQTRTDEGSAYAQAAMIVAGWRALEVERPIVVGHSFGGAVGLGMAIASPEAVTGVIALAPICFPEVRLEQMLLGQRAMPVAGELSAWTHGRLVDAATLPLLRNAMFLPQTMPDDYATAFPFAWATHPSMMIADAKDSLASWRDLTRSAWQYASCRTPVVVFGGTLDIVVRNGAQGFVAAAMMPNGSFVWIDGAGHMLHHFQQQTIKNAIVNLLMD